MAGRSPFPRWERLFLSLGLGGRPAVRGQSGERHLPVREKRWEPSPHPASSCPVTVTNTDFSGPWFPASPSSSVRWAQAVYLRSGRCTRYRPARDRSTCRGHSPTCRRLRSCPGRPGRSPLWSRAPVTPSRKPCGCWESPRAADVKSGARTRVACTEQGRPVCHLPPLLKHSKVSLSRDIAAPTLTCASITST